ncbi:Gfo/Idh/MocA family protein [Paracoccus shanxieyensis]|uniref:Gfo/Idh/MocA family oxidoreductase n=1 Tax=Paracoccus shanxieyensis TaxID=2675752 RepID=A0A6L6J0Y8_9RHOB|nr:Gfo/Idh/MocA family oxidoreductase [Paracoccus shanxieyensis]MTH65561.1 gfo/Idh/MocA family oxidoreductase [Paracoccus shanxieyensis]MTH88643.1 gfo/Idh/MocA family oxidoreductase [Paracoccus shanxieyensis]
MTPIRLGMVGGGAGAFIGAVHRIAARLDGQFQLVAGALSSDPDRARASADELGIRSYDDFTQMALAEAARADGIQAVSIVTPNHMHAAPAAAFLRAGIHVICDKPLAATPAQAAEIAGAVSEGRARFFLTHNYAAMPMVREARALVQDGALGQIRLVQAEYLQGWLSDDTHSKQAEWRTDPARAGAGALGDIGTHAWQLAAFVTGMTPSHISADLSSMVPGRPIDDDARVALRYATGAKGGIWASQVAVGQENGLSLRVFGTRAALDWRLEASEKLVLSPKDGPAQILTRAQDRSASFRTPPGHPEGYLEGFANIYKDVAAIIRGDSSHAVRVPGLADGLSGMAFIAACKASAKQDSAWVEVAA